MREIQSPPQTSPQAALRRTIDALVGTIAIAGGALATAFHSLHMLAVALAIALAAAVVLSPWRHVRESSPDLMLIAQAIAAIDTEEEAEIWAEGPVPPAPPPHWRNLPQPTLDRLRSHHAAIAAHVPFEEWIERHLRLNYADGHWQIFYIEPLYLAPRR